MQRDGERDERRREAERAAPRHQRPKIDFDDPLTMRSSDDADAGWGEPPSESDPDDLARFLRAKPPHHL